MIWYYVIGINLLCFLLMGIDKWKAKEHRWRIPEKSLFLAAFLGGALGGTCGMFLFHHKTFHAKFRVGFPIMAIFQMAILSILSARGIL